jgi:hypothetical protein
MRHNPIEPAGASCHIEYMDNVAVRAQGQISLEALGEFAQQHVSDWFERCDSFFEWQRTHFLESAPSSALLNEHRSIVKLLLRVLRLLYVEVSDPDFPNKAISEDFHWRLGKLEDSWLMFHGRMSDAEAERILNQAFPE